MLRRVLTAVAALVLAGTATVWALAPLRAVALWPGMFWSALVLAGLVFERFVYKPIRRDLPGAGWEATGERFIDPATRREVQVFFRPADGKRMYVRADAARPQPPPTSD
ncbi:MAG TPA: hypothetical protein VL358_11485 [Caulobacteraceae bacterium]|jgi:hypothetical protein|nr:hypothetical protein [Caulobacteraceae bacterium]